MKKPIPKYLIENNFVQSSILAFFFFSVGIFLTYSSYAAGGILNTPTTSTQTVSDTLTAGQTDYWLMSTTIGNEYLVSLCGADGGSATFDTTLNAAGNYNDDFCGLQSRVLFTATSTDTYIAVGSYANSYGGPYTLAYQASAPVIDPIYVNNNLGSDTPGCGVTNDAAACSSIDYAISEGDSAPAKQTIRVVNTGTKYIQNGVLSPHDHLFFEENVEIDFNADLTLPDSAQVTLTFESGADAAFTSNAQLYVGTDNNLDVNGSSVSPVVFRSINDSSAGEWKGIVINGSGNVNIDGAKIRHAGDSDCTEVAASLPAALCLYSSGGGGYIIQNTEIYNNSGAGILVGGYYYGDYNLTIGNSRNDNAIYNNDYGIYSLIPAYDGHYYPIKNNYIGNNSISGIYLGTEGPSTYMGQSIVNNLIVNNSVTGLTVESDYFDFSFYLLYNTFAGNGTGLLVNSSNYTNPYLANNIFADNTVGFESNISDYSEVFNNLFSGNTDDDGVGALDGILLGNNGNFSGSADFVDGPDNDFYTDANGGDNYYLGGSSAAIDGAASFYPLDTYEADVTTQISLSRDSDPFDIGFHYGNSLGEAWNPLYVNSNSGYDAIGCGEADNSTACASIDFAVSEASGNTETQTIQVAGGVFNSYAVSGDLSLGIDSINFGDGSIVSFTNSTLSMDANVNASITVGAGSGFTFDNTSKINVTEGNTININGNSGQIVNFTSSNPGVVYWDGIKITNPAQNTNISYLNIASAGGNCADTDSNKAMICLENISGSGTVNIFNSEFGSAEENGITIQGGVASNKLFIGGDRVDHLGNYFHDISGYGIFADLDSGESQNVVIANNYFVSASGGDGFFYADCFDSGCSNSSSVGNYEIVNNLINISNAVNFATAIFLGGDNLAGTKIGFNTIFDNGVNNHYAINLTESQSNYPEIYSNIFSGVYYGISTALAALSDINNNLYDSVDNPANPSSGINGSLPSTTDIIGSANFIDGPDFGIYFTNSTGGDDFYQNASAGGGQSFVGNPVTDYLTTSTTNTGLINDASPFDIGFHYGNANGVLSTIYVNNVSGTDAPGCGADQGGGACATYSYAQTEAENAPGNQEVVLADSGSAYSFSGVVNVDSDSLTIATGTEINFDGNLEVIQDAGATLTIQEGAQLNFEPNSALIVNSGNTVNFVGSSGSPIVLTSTADTAPGEWRGLVLDGLTGDNTISNVVVRNAGQAACAEAGVSNTAGICITNLSGANSLKIQNSKIQNNQGSGILVVGAVPADTLTIGIGSRMDTEISGNSIGIEFVLAPAETQSVEVIHNYIHDNSTVGIKVDNNAGGTPDHEIVNNLIENNLTGIDIESASFGSNFIIAYNTLTDNSTAAINIDLLAGLTNPLITNNILSGNGIGMESNGGDASTISYNLFSSNADNDGSGSLNGILIGVQHNYNGTVDFVDGPDFAGVYTDVNGGDNYYLGISSEAIDTFNTAYPLSNWESDVTTQTSLTRDIINFDLGFHYGNSIAPVWDPLYVNSVQGTDVLGCGQNNSNYACATLEFAASEAASTTALQTIIVADSGDTLSITSPIVLSGDNLTFAANAKFEADASISADTGSGINITLEEGVIGLFADSPVNSSRKGIHIGAGNSLDINGSSLNRVTLAKKTSTALSFWKGIYISSPNSDSTIQNLDLSGADNDDCISGYSGTSICVNELTGSGKLEIFESDISLCDAVAIGVVGSTSPNRLYIGGDGINSRGNKIVCPEAFFASIPDFEVQSGLIANNFLKTATTSLGAFITIGDNSSLSNLSASNYEIVNNLIDLSDGGVFRGIWHNTNDDGFLKYAYNTFVNNDLFGSPPTGIEIYSGLNPYIYDNIFVGLDYAIYANSDSSTSYFQHNLYYDIATEPGGGALSGQLPKAGDLSADPLFVDGPDFGFAFTDANGGDDYYLSASSPALNAAHYYYDLGNFLNPLNRTSSVDLLVDFSPYNLGFHYGNSVPLTPHDPLYVNSSLGIDTANCGISNDANACNTIEYAVGQAAASIETQTIQVATAVDTYSVPNGFNLTSDHITFNEDVKVEIAGDIVIEENVGSQININAGAEFYFDSGNIPEFKVRSGNTINVNGTALKPVLMTSTNNTGAGEWKGLSIIGPAQDSVIDYLELRYAGASSCGETSNDFPSGICITNLNNAGSLSIYNSKIHDNLGAGIQLGGVIGENKLFIGKGSRKDNEIYNNEVGIYWVSIDEINDEANGQIINNYVYNNSGAGISIEFLDKQKIVNNLITGNDTGMYFNLLSTVGSEFLAAYNTIDSNTAYGISMAGVSANPQITNNIISNNDIGMESEQSNTDVIYHNLFSGNNDNDGIGALDGVLIGINNNFVGTTDFVDGPDFNPSYRDVNNGDNYYLGASSDAVDTYNNLVLLSTYETDITTQTSLAVDLSPFDLGFHYGNSISPSNTAPAISLASAVQAVDGSGEVTISFAVSDADNDDTVRALVEYMIDGVSYNAALISETDSKTTATFGDPQVDNNAAYQIGTDSGFILTSSGSNTITTVWNSKPDVAADTNNAFIRITPFDGVDQGTPFISAAFTVDNQNPDLFTGFSGNSSAYNTVDLDWSFADTDIDTNFDHFEIWYGLVENDVINRTGTAVEYDNDDDSNLATETTLSAQINGLDENTQYYFKIWAIDSFGNETTIDAVSVTTAARPLIVSAVSPNQITDGSGFLFLEITTADSDSLTINGLVEFSTDGVNYSKAALAGPVLATHGASPNIDNLQAYPLQNIDSTTDNTLTFYVDTKLTGFTNAATTNASLRISASDGVNTSNQVVFGGVAIDNENPASVVDIAGGTYAIGQTVTITAYENDTLGTPDPLAAIYYTTDGTEPTTSNYTGLAYGSVTIGVGSTTTLRYFAIDGAGNSEIPKHTDQYNIRSVPIIVIDSPSPLLKTNASTINVSGFITDSNILVSAAVNGDTASLDGGSFSKTFTAGIPISGPDGAFEINVIAQNDLGDTGSSSINIIRDTTPPSPPTILSTDTATNNASYLITGIKDAESSVYLGAIEIAPLDSSTTWSYPATLLSGNNSFSFTSRDDLDNESTSSTYEIELDTIGPSLIIDPYPASTEDATYEFTGSTDAYADIYVDDIFEVEADEFGNFSFTKSLSIGINNYSVKAIDDALNESTPEAIAITRTLPSGISVTAITITPSTTRTIGTGGTLDFSATATYSDLSVADVTDIVDWASNNDLIGTISQNGVFNALSAGFTSVAASFYDSISDTLITSSDVGVFVSFVGGGGGGGGSFSTGGTSGGELTGLGGNPLLPEETPTPSPTTSSSPTPSPSATPVPSSTPLISVTSTPVPTTQPSPSPIPTFVPTPVNSPTPSSTATPTPQPTAAPVIITATATPSSTPQIAATATPTPEAATPEAIAPTPTPFVTTNPDQVTPAPTISNGGDNNSPHIDIVDNRETTLIGGELTANSQTANDLQDDSDGDGFSDVEEEINGSNPYDPSSTPVDGNGNGIGDVWERVYLITPQDGAQDSDADGCSDVIEAKYGLNPTIADSDGDGINDCAEINDYNTNPLKYTSIDEILAKNPIYLNTNANTYYKAMNSVFTGRAPSGSTVILYIVDDNNLRTKIGETVATEDHKFLVVPESLPNGRYKVMVETRVSQSEAAKFDVIRRQLEEQENRKLALRNDKQDVDISFGENSIYLKFEEPVSLRDISNYINITGVDDSEKVIVRRANTNEYYEYWLTTREGATASEKEKEAMKQALEAINITENYDYIAENDTQANLDRLIIIDYSEAVSENGGNYRLELLEGLSSIYGSQLTSHNSGYSFNIPSKATTKIPFNDLLKNSITQLPYVSYQSDPVEIQVDKDLDVEEPIARKFSSTILNDTHITGEVKLSADNDRPLIEGYFEQPDTFSNTKVVAHWRSLLLTSALIADTSKGDFKLYAPDNLEPGNHTVYLYTVKTEGGVLKRSKDVTFKFTVPEKSDETGIPLWVYILALLIAIGIMIYLYKRNKKLKAKNLSEAETLNKEENNDQINSSNLNGEEINSQPSVQEVSQQIVPQIQEDTNSDETTSNQIIQPIKKSDE